jgi:hypothetical protein
MSWKQYVVPFTLGVVAGAVVARNWERIRDVSRPLLRGAVRGGTNLLEKGREAYHEQSEKFSDLVAEIREEEEAKAKAKAGNPPEAPRPT